MLEYPSSVLPKAGAHRRTQSSFTPADSRSSSLQKVWAEDYVTDEYSDHYSNQLDNIITSPAPVSLNGPDLTRNIPLPYDEHQATSREPRTHQRSLTALLPFRTSRTNSESPQRSPQRSPIKEKLDFDFVPTLTGDMDGQIKIADKSKGGLSGWFSGTSTPHSIGVPIDDLEESTIMPSPSKSSRQSSPSRSKHLPSRLDTFQQTSTKGATTSASRFAFFSPKATGPKEVQIPSELCDELLTLDIRSALFPSGGIDPFSPSAFKNLLQNAEGLLNKLQNAYKIRTLSLHELKAEKEAQADELEEAETRAKHLKMQLEEMAQRVMAHDQEMKNVVAELVKEKQARAEEEEAREKSINFVKSRSRSASQVMSEDLEVDTRQRRHPWRHSDATINSETSYESDEEVVSSAESVFDRSMSPSLTSVSEMGTPEMGQAVFAKVVNIAPRGPFNPVSERPRPIQRRSTFQKILSGMSPSAQEDEARKQPEVEDELGIAQTGCRNCRGGPATVAWDTVGLLKAENKGLKGRVASLETAMEGALDVVNGLRVGNTG